MNPNKLIRDAEKIKNCLVEISDGRLVTKKELKIIIPVRFEERGLAFVGVDTSIIGIYAMVLDDTYYAISLVNAMIKIEPTSIIKIDINEVQHYQFTFEAGSTVMSSVNLVKSDAIVYKIYDEIISKARVPWYVNYSDLGKLFDTARYHAGANIGSNHEVTELLVSLISRDSTDRRKYYRQSIKSLSDVSTKPPAYISLKNITYSATNTTNKLAGSYMHAGIVSALVSPSDRVEKIERVLRR